MFQSFDKTSDGGTRLARRLYEMICIILGCYPLYPLYVGTTYKKPQHGFNSLYLFN